MTTEGAVKVIAKQSKLSIATGKKDDVSKMSLDTTSVAVAQSSNLSDSDTVSIQEDELSSQSKATGNSKAVQAKRCAQKRSCSIVELDEDSVERMTSVTIPAKIKNFEVQYLTLSNGTNRYRLVHRHIHTEILPNFHDQTRTLTALL